MIKIFVNNVDITSSVQFQSLSLTDQLNNRRNTAKFIVNNLAITEAQKVEIYKGAKLSSNISAGVSSFVVDEILDKWDFFRVWDQILLGAETANEEILTISGITPGTKTLATNATRFSHTKGDIVGKRIFAGLTLKNPREEIGKSDVLTYQVDCTDLSTIFDTHNVVDTYLAQYACEIIGRIVYKYTAPDSTINLNDMETLTGITSSGVAVAPVLDSSDKIYKNQSVQIGSSAAGSAIYNFVSNPLSFDGDFDEGGYDGAFTWKRGTNATAGQMDTTMLATGGFNGGKCMRISPTVTGKFVEMTTLINAYWSSTGITIKPNTKYYLKGKIKVVWTGTIGGGAKIVCLMNDATATAPSRQQASSNSVSTDTSWQWVDLQVSFTSNSLATVLRVQPRVYNHTGSPTFIGDIYFDQITLSEEVDMSTTDNFRLWEKMPASVSNWISGQKVRLLSSPGNYYEWTDARLYDGIWSFDSFDFKRGTITGTPNLASITAVEVELIATKAIPVGTFKLDHLFCTKGGFTIRGVERGNVLFKDVRAQYKKPTVLVESLSKNDGFSWYVDTMSDVRYFSNENRLAPFNIVAPSGKNYWPLKITADITNLKNRVVVRGGIAPSDFLYTQEKVLDGKETSYRLDYSPKWLKVYLDTGAGYVLKTVGVENLVSDTSVDFVFNFSEKTVRNGAVGLQTSGTKIKLEYYPYKDVRVSAQDDVSIATMKTLLGGDGIFDGAVINDASLRTFDEARARAKAEIAAYSNPVLTATFTTETDGLEAGQTIHVTDPVFGIDKDFVIQKVDKKIRDNSGIFLSNVQAGTTLYWLTEFFQYLLKMYGTGEIDSAELVDRVQPVDETMIFGDVITSTKKSNVFYAHSRTWNYDYTLTFTEGGTSNDAYADFCVVS